MVSRYLELLNATIGLSLLILIVVIVRDFKKQLLRKDIKIQVPLALLGTGILVLSIKELYKYGIFGDVNPAVSELMETFYLLLTLAAFFLFLRIKELARPKIKT
ncbi:MAG: hypothetical protein FIB08_10560 [Candidatus Methanoperedens sp.]|nr:hypothetical protein [Candidatus Methanoperedens sp.]